MARLIEPGWLQGHFIPLSALVSAPPAARARRRRRERRRSGK